MTISKKNDIETQFCDYIMQYCMDCKPFTIVDRFAIYDKFQIYDDKIKKYLIKFKFYTVLDNWCDDETVMDDYLDALLLSILEPQANALKN